MKHLPAAIVATLVLACDVPIARAQTMEQIERARADLERRRPEIEKLSRQLHEQAQRDEAMLDVRIAKALEASGDFERIIAFVRMVPRIAAATVREKNPAAAAKIEADLAASLSEESLRHALLDSIGPGLHDHVDALERWSASPARVTVDAALREAPRVPAAGEPVSEARRARLLRIARATMIGATQAGQRTALGRLSATASDTADPEASAMGRMPFVGFSAVPDTELVDQWLAPMLSRVSDADLDAYLAFAESRAGNRFYAAISFAPGWLMEKQIPVAVAAIRKYAPPTIVVGEGEDAEALLSQARANAEFGLDLPGTRKLLVRANALKPNDARILTEIGLNETRLRNGMRPADDEWRVPGPDRSAEAARQALMRAVELDPKNAAAWSYLGYIHYLAHEDDLAAAAYAKAVALDPKAPWLGNNRAMLAAVQGRIDEAIALDIEVLNDEHASRLVRNAAFTALCLLFTEAKRGPELQPIARAYLDATDAAAPRVRYARFLLQNELETTEAIARLEQVADDYPRKKEVLSQAKVLQAYRGIVAAGAPTEAHRAELREAIEIAGSAEALVDGIVWIPKGIPAASYVVEETKDKALATRHLGYTVAGNSPDDARRMLALGADPNGRAYPIDETMLAGTVLTRNAALFAALLEHGADPEKPFRDGRTIREFLEQHRSDAAIAEMQKALDARAE